jgi:septum formation protein
MHMSCPLILASASPRRRELLRQLGVRFEVVPSDTPETPLPGELPADFARRVAREKAIDVARRRPGTVVVGADTVVVLDGEIFGKPRDGADARRMLRRLSARVHRVLTAVALVDAAGAVDVIGVESEVEFRALTDAEIDAYVATGEPFDKAGAYAVQGGAGHFVTRLTGSRSNVVGLPIEEVADLLRRHLTAEVVREPAADDSQRRPR